MKITIDISWIIILSAFAILGVFTLVILITKIVSVNKTKKPYNKLHSLKKQIIALENDFDIFIIFTYDHKKIKHKFPNYKITENNDYWVDTTSTFEEALKYIDDFIKQGNDSKDVFLCGEILTVIDNELESTGYWIDWEKLRKPYFEYYYGEK